MGVLLEAGNNRKIKDLRALNKMSLVGLSLNATSITDLSPLNTKQLKSLDISETNISDLSHLSSSPKLTRLSIKYCNIQSIAPLFSLKSLQQITVTKKLNDFEKLTSIKSLKIITVKIKEYTIAEFKKEF